MYPCTTPIDNIRDSCTVGVPTIDRKRLAANRRPLAPFHVKDLDALSTTR